MMIALLSSCTGIRYGSSTKVTIESTDGLGDNVNITAVGKKKTIQYTNVTLPYRMKVKHNNLPLRVSVESQKNLYPYFSINKKETEWGKAERQFWYILGLAEGIGLPAIGLGASIASNYYKVMPLMGGIGLGIGGLCFAFGALSVPYIPDKKNYFVTPTHITQANAFRNTEKWKKTADVLDIYELLKESEYEVARNKAAYLLTQNKTGELHYLKGVSEYQIGKYKIALKDLRTALYSADVTEDMKTDIRKYIEAAENSRQLQLQERQNRWASYVSAALQVTSTALQYSQMNQMQQSGSNFNGFQRDKSMDYLLDPRYAIMQVQQQYYNEYLQMTNGGQTMTYDEWFQKIKGPALAEEYRIEHGLSSGSSQNDEEEYKGELSPDQYEAAYRRWESRVQDWFNNLTSGGIKVQDKQGNIKGKTDGDMKGWAYVGNQSGLKRAQNEMRKIRLEAEKYGVHIVQSKWETATANY